MTAEATETQKPGFLSRLATGTRQFFSPTRLIGFTALILLILLRLYPPQVIENIRHQGFDLMQQIKPREYSKQPIVIVDIDEEALQKYGQWPWPRTLIAQLITSLAQRGAIVTGFDIIFSEPDRLSPALIAQDNPLLDDEMKTALKALPDNEFIMANSMRRHRVILGQTSVRDSGDVSGKSQEIRDASHAVIGPDPKSIITDFHELVQNMPSLEDVASGRGVFTVEPDADGIYRRVPLVMLVSGKIRLALSAELLRVATGGDSFAIKSNAAGVEGIVVGRNLVQTDRKGKVWPYFTPSNSARYVSAGSVLDGSVDLAKIRGHMVLVGTSAVGLEDYRPTPLGFQMPGVEIHAQVLENILTQQMLSRPATSKFIEMLYALFAGLLIVIIVPRLGAVLSFGMAAIMIAAAIGVSWYYFTNSRFLLDATFPVITIFAMFILIATANYIREEQQRGQIRNAFGQYLSPALVDQLSDDPDRLVLGGETRELSLLFMDVRGFTSISESYKDYPQGLTQLMNRFLTVLSQPILDRNGTIDKYMGDAIMAFWNAPVEEKKHAYQACHSALTMMNDVVVLNKSREEELKNNPNEEYLAINIGIGINTGPCVVGNMGSENRFDYTALGDTVNLASRLEGQSKPYGLPIVIGAGTAEQVTEELAVFEIDLIRVKGKNEPVKIFALAGDETMFDSDDFKAFRAMNAAMLSAYRTQDWQSAIEALEMMEGLGEKLGITIGEYVFIYETRIAEFSANPPGAQWDGVYTATSK